MSMLDLAAAASTLAEGWFQRNHPDSPGITISDDEMIAAAYEVRAELAADDDPTPWCSRCGARRQADCHCGPIDPMD